MKNLQLKSIWIVEYRIHIVWYFLPRCRLIFYYRTLYWLHFRSRRVESLSNIKVLMYTWWQYHLRLEGIWKVKLQCGKPLTAKLILIYCNKGLIKCTLFQHGRITSRCICNFISLPKHLTRIRYYFQRKGSHYINNIKVYL